MFSRSEIDLKCVFSSELTDVYQSFKKITITLGESLYPHPNLSSFSINSPPISITEIPHYAEYLATKYTQTPLSKTILKTYRQAGNMKGMFAVSDDFDASLEDLKDYM